MTSLQRTCRAAGAPSDRQGYVCRHVDIVEASLDQIDKHNASSSMPSSSAQPLETSPSPSPRICGLLHGIPITIKDNIMTDPPCRRWPGGKALESQPAGQLWAAKPKHPTSLGASRSEKSCLVTWFVLTSWSREHWLTMIPDSRWLVLWKCCRRGCRLCASCFGYRNRRSIVQPAKRAYRYTS